MPKGLAIVAKQIPHARCNELMAQIAKHSMPSLPKAVDGSVKLYVQLCVPRAQYLHMPAFSATCCVYCQPSSDKSFKEGQQSDRSTSKHERQSIAQPWSCTFQCLASPREPW